MLAGMLSVLLVAGLTGAGVYVATGEPDPAPAAEPAPEPVAEAPAPLPKVALRDLKKAAAAAGCTLQSPPNEGADHDVREFTAADYRVNPPTSGIHFPEWAPDGVYDPGTTPPLGTLVHTLEHGRVNLQYAQGTPPDTVERLKALVDELEGGYHLLLYENTTEMPFAVAATAWDHLLGCPEMNEQVFDALRAFRNAYVDKGPETVP
jgi:hypothetical protein